MIIQTPVNWQLCYLWESSRAENSVGEKVLVASVTFASDAGKAQVLLSLTEVNTERLSWLGAMSLGMSHSGLYLGIHQLSLESDMKTLAVNTSLEILLNPPTLIQVEHYRLLLIPLPFTWFETASSTTGPVYLIPLHWKNAQMQSTTLWICAVWESSNSSAALWISSAKYISFPEQHELYTSQLASVPSNADCWAQCDQETEMWILLDLRQQFRLCPHFLTTQTVPPYTGL